MRNNYLTAAFAAQTMLKLWLEDDAKKRMSLSNGFKPSEQRKRRIVFICSTAVFVGLPGYDAYTPAKAAVRALADILRSEVYQYSGPGAISDYKIHCAFPSNFGSAAFLEEQKHKPVMTCRFEGTLVESEEELLKRVPTARYVAERIVHGVEQGKDFVILDGSAVSELLYAGMRGPSPARGLGLVDFFASLAMLAVWPWLRRRLDRLCAGNKDI
ncbi:uncharacterized protein MYCFIDRAFT_34072 [Pseudocercospora fijiensis CIRAD86]|uniref:Uncharacterized protein n=1 Tax=Pseudocercospora fijiensis (strain CIRAD86) TaxID=383855 RepID=M3A363_PSEFD|nr:uncharacterized protein MYCFIDRAFT_34072 [Pseudocercospora fijiensis CIRAD86]EME79086.1 hypothetical protein MYCFIDRAFT_34072 [Pseudocercospora fijiensis CIRAD86]